MVYFGDKVDHPFFFGMGYAGNLIDDIQEDKGGLYLPESAVANLPKPIKREIGFNAIEVRVQQEGNQREHRNRNEGR